MKKILSFNLFEATRDEHFVKRVKQRILNLKEINLNPKVESDLEKEIGPDWRSLLIDAIVKNTQNRIFKAVEATEYKYNHNFAVPISSLYLIHGGKKYPIVITASTKPGEKNYYGNQIWISVRQNEAITVKVFQKDKDTDYISKNMEEGGSDRYKENKYELIRPKGDFESIFEWDAKEGKFITKEDEEKEKDLVPVSSNVEIQFTLSPGTDIGYYSKLTDSIVKGKIMGVINKDKYKLAKEFQLDILKPDGSKSIKKLKSGDEVYLPVGKDKSLIKTKVADPIYVTDDRVSSPIIKILV